MTLLQGIGYYCGTIVLSWLIIGLCSGWSCEPDVALGGAIIWPFAILRYLVKCVCVYWKESK